MVEQIPVIGRILFLITTPETGLPTGLAPVVSLGRSAIGLLGARFGRSEGALGRGRREVILIRRAIVLVSLVEACVLVGCSEYQV